MPKSLDLNTTVEGMLKMLRRLIGEDIDLVWRPGANLCRIKMDPSQLDQILANLCVNARDAIAGEGKIVIETGRVALDEAFCAAHPGSVPGEHALLAVGDTGRGMDKNEMANIFEPFYTTKDVGEGTGLGLATVYGAVRQNKGLITVDSEPGRGTTFRIYLPRHEEQAAEGRPAAPDLRPARAGETLLLVEDDPHILKIIAAMLERLGYAVLAASTPGEALRLAGKRDGPIRLLLTDVIMPEMNGRELFVRLLALRPDLKCLFMSGYTANVIAHHGVLDAGMNFIQKPFSINDLANKVAEALNGGVSPKNGPGGGEGNSA